MKTQTYEIILKEQYKKGKVDKLGLGDSYIRIRDSAIKRLEKGGNLVMGYEIEFENEEDDMILYTMKFQMLNEI